MAPPRPPRLHETDRFLAGSAPTIGAVHDEGAVDDEVVTRELGFAVGPLRRTTFRRELQQVCVELGLGCEIDEHRRLLTTRLSVLVRGTRESVDALLDYARVSGWSTWSDDALGDSPG
jgi:hypothetical protein